MTKTLNLYKERDYTEIVLSDKKTYKIPNEFTVEEVERILEKQAQIEKLANTVVDDDKDESVQGLRKFWELVFAQIEILFQHYQPKVTADKLRLLLSQQDALKIINFQKLNKYGIDNPTPEDTKAKKKITNSN